MKSKLDNTWKIQMKHLLIPITAAVLAIGCMAKAEIIPNNTTTWKASCKGDYPKTPDRGTYIFHVKHGEVGPCPSDKIHQDHGYGFTYDWSERAEVSTRNKQMFGKFEWSATIDVNRNCIPAMRNTLFQVHAGGYLVNPPSWVGIDRWNKFRNNEKGNSKGSISPVPDEPFKLIAKIHTTRKEVTVEYFVNDKFLTSTRSKAKREYTEMFFKFGIYRVLSNCDITQRYTNVKLKRVK